MNWRAHLKIFLHRQIAQLPHRCDMFLRVSGWLTVCALCTAGVWACLLLALGDFELGGMVFEIDNLVHHFLAADPVVRARVGGVAGVATGVLFAGIAFFRRHSLTLGSNRKEARHGSPIPKTA